MQPYRRTLQEEMVSFPSAVYLYLLHFFFPPPPHPPLVSDHCQNTNHSVTLAVLEGVGGKWGWGWGGRVVGLSGADSCMKEKPDSQISGQVLCHRTGREGGGGEELSVCLSGHVSGMIEEPDSLIPGQHLGRQMGGGGRCRGGGGGKQRDVDSEVAQLRWVAVRPF